MNLQKLKSLALALTVAALCNGCASQDLASGADGKTVWWVTHLTDGKQMGPLDIEPDEYYGHARHIEFDYEGQHYTLQDSWAVRAEKR